MNTSKCPHCGLKLGNFLHADACPHCHHELLHNTRPLIPNPVAPPRVGYTSLLRCLRRIRAFVES